MSGAVQRVEAFRPDILLAVSSGPRNGGSVPALMLKACLHHDGFSNVPLHTLNLSNGVTDLASMTPQQLNGAHVLLVEKADGTRRTLSAAVMAVEQIFAAAAMAASGDCTWQSPQLGVFVLHNKRRAKDASLPAALLESCYFAAEEVEDAMYQYPWDREDKYMTSWRGACAPLVAAPATTATAASNTAVESAELEDVQVDEQEEVPLSSTLASPPERSFNASGPTWVESLGPAFIAAWREACFGVDADVAAARAAEAAAACPASSSAAPCSWRRRVGDEFIAAWRGACGAADGADDCSSRPLQPEEKVVVAPTSTSTADGELDAVRIGASFMPTWRRACAEFDADRRSPSSAAPSWRRQLGDSYIAAWRGACGRDAAAEAPRRVQPEEEVVASAPCLDSTTAAGVNGIDAERVGAGFAASWRGACSGFDAEQQAGWQDGLQDAGIGRAGQGVAEARSPSWSQQVCSEYISAWCGACGVAAPAGALQLPSATSMLSFDQVEVKPAATQALGCSATTLNQHLAQQYIAAYRSACLAKAVV